MSVWRDIHQRSNGEKVRKEDKSYGLFDIEIKVDYWDEIDTGITNLKKKCDDLLKGLEKDRKDLDRMKKQLERACAILKNCK